MELKEYLIIIQKRLWIIVTITLVFSIISGLISIYVLDEVYQSDTSIFVGKSNNMQNDQMVYNDILIGNQLVKDYRELVKSRLITNIVIKRLNLPLNAKQLSRKLNVSLRNDTRFIEITAQDTDPVMAQKIANEIASVFKEKAVELIDVENVQIIDVAELPTEPIKPNRKLNIAIAAFIGLMVGIGLVFLIEYMDNTIKTVDDIKKYVDLPVIGTIIQFPD